MNTLDRLLATPECPNGHGSMQRQPHWSERIPGEVVGEVALPVFGVLAIAGTAYFAATAAALLILSLGVFTERTLMPFQCAQCGAVRTRWDRP